MARHRVATRAKVLFRSTGLSEVVVRWMASGESAFSLDGLERSGCALDGLRAKVLFRSMGLSEVVVRWMGLSEVVVRSMGSGEVAFFARWA